MRSGMGIVPADPLGRRFRDLSGMANQRIAEAADTVDLHGLGNPTILEGCSVRDFLQALSFLTILPVGQSSALMRRRDCPLDGLLSSGWPCDRAAS